MRPEFLKAPSLITLLLFFSLSIFSQGLKPSMTGYAPVNGLQMYYEIYGEGKPLVLIHGAFNSINVFNGVIPGLAKNHKLIAVEMQGHGRTADIDRPFSFEAMADDVASLLTYLKIDSADVFGYSMGGGIAQQLAIRHPARVKKLVLASCPYKFEGWFPETRAIFPTVTPEAFASTPMKAEYDRLAPDPSHWSVFINKMVQFISKNYDFTAAKFKAIKSPKLIIIGDSDGVMPEHAIEMFHLTGGGGMGDLSGLTDSQLAIIPATTHVGLMMQTDYLLMMIPKFLDGK